MTDLWAQDCMALASRWADDAGIVIEWVDEPAVLGSMLAQDDGSKRAHFRCALELVRLCAARSGREVAELLRDLRPQPAGAEPA